MYISDAAYLKQAKTHDNDNDEYLYIINLPNHICVAHYFVRGRRGGLYN